MLLKNIKRLLSLKCRQKGTIEYKYLTGTYFEIKKFAKNRIVAKPFVFKI